MTFAQSELSSLKNGEKPAQQINSQAVTDLAHHLLLRTLMHSMIWHLDTRVHRGPYRQGNWHFAEVSIWDASQRHTAKNDETLRAGVNCVEQSVIDQTFDQWRHRLNVKAKGKHVERLF